MKKSTPTITRKELIQTVEFKSATGKLAYEFIEVETGLKVPFVTEYLKLLSESGLASNTIIAYKDDLYDFYCYLILCMNHLHLMKDEEQVFSTIILLYPNYLLRGKNSDNKLVNTISTILNFNGVAQATANRRISSVQNYIEESERFHNKLVDLNSKNLVETNIKKQLLFSKLDKRKPLNQKQQTNLLKKSMFAGVISGGPKLTRSKLFKVKSVNHQSEAETNKAFPLEHIVELMECAESNRDRALLSLLAGTGIRTSEALNLRFEDIDILNEKVKIFHPNETNSELTYTQIASKGRNNNETVFIEPFKTIFFDSLSDYLKYERPKNLSHKFIFVTLSNRNKGTPLLLGKANAHGNIIKSAQKKIKAIKKTYTLHSLRHFYCVFLINYIPNGDGTYGLELADVQRAVGHSSITTTARYAIPDYELRLKRIERFNENVINNGFKETIYNKDIDHEKIN